MNYKKILNNKLLILIDKGFRLLGFYTILIVQNEKILNIKFGKTGV